MNLPPSEFELFEDEDGDFDDEEIVDKAIVKRILPVPCGCDVTCNCLCVECMIPDRYYTLKELDEHERQKMLTIKEMLDEIDMFGIEPVNRHLPPNPNWIWS